MAPITSARIATCVVTATLVSAAAAILPTEARADDGPAAVPAVPVTAPSVDTGAVLAGEASAAVEGAVDSVLGTAAQAADATAPMAPAPTVPTASPATPTPPAAAPVADPAPNERATTPDTTQVSPDTVAGIATTPPTATPAPAAAVQQSPSNINVSVRIGSPGDNGAVTQVNVAPAASGGGSGTSTEPATKAATPSTSSSTSTAAPQPAAASPASAEDDSDTWTWQWNCLSKPDFTVIPTTGSATGSVPKNWTWIWNCGENPTQYQDATVAQYQPTNTNISIRISSPGNDGPVSQSNVAVAAHIGLPVVAVAPGGPLVSVSLPAPVATVVTEAVIPAMTSLPALVQGVEPIFLGSDVSVPSIVETVDDTVDLPFVLAPLLGDGALGAGERQSAFPGMRGLTFPTIGRLAPSAPLEPQSRFSGSDSANASVDGRSAGSGRAASPVAEKAEKDAARWHAPVPERIPATIPSGASFAPATGGGSSGGGIPIFLALPFLAAMLDLARRVTLDRAALPLGHRSRMPDDPG